MPKLSVIIPAYNERAAIVQVLEAVAAQRHDGIEFETIVVDDGSIDGTADLVAERPDLHTKLIRQPRNGGKGMAVQAGLRAATGDFILFQDADLEYDPADFSALLEPVVRFDADIVMGSRLVASRITRVHYFWHKVGNRFITLLFNVLNNTTYTDIYSCYLLFRRSLIDPDQLRTFGWEQQAEILTLATRRAKRIFEVPISYYGRSYDEGKKIRAHHVIPVIWTIITQRFRA